MKKQNTNIEIELRFKVESSKNLEKNLQKIGAKLKSKKHLIDHWFIPNEIKSRKQHDTWFDSERGCGIRIREQLDTNKKTVSLETKKLTKDKNHNTFLETELNIENYSKGKSFLKMIGRKEFLTIDKKRTTYSYKNFEICVDVIKDYGTGIEIEIRDEEDRLEALKKIQELVEKLKIDRKNTADKSITVMAMKKLAIF